MSIFNSNIVYGRIMDFLTRPLKVIILIGVILYLANFLSGLIISPIDDGLKIGVMLALGLPLILITRPIWSFMALLFTRPLLEPLWEYRFVIGGSVLGIFSLIYIVIALYLLIRDQQFKILHDKIKWHYYFIIISIFSLYNTSNVALSVTTISRHFILLALFLLSYNIIEKFEDALKIIRVLVMSSVIPVMYGIYQAITGTGVQEYKSFQVMAGVARVNSFYNLSNGFAYFLGVIIFLIILCFFHLKRKNEMIYYSLLLAGSLVCLAYTHVRTIWISFFLSISLLSIYDKKIRKYFILITIIALPLTYHLMMQRFTDVFVRPEYGTSSLEFRTGLGRELLSNAFPKHFLIGFGSGLDKEVATAYTNYVNMPHNDYLRVLIENGILGLIAYLLFLGNILFYLFNLIRNKVNIRENSIFLALLIYYLIASAGQNIFSTVSSSGLIFCLMGIAVKMNEISMKSVETAFEK